MKTLIAVWNHGGRGKSATLRYFADLLYKKSQVLFEDNYLNPRGIDFRLILKYNGKIIAIESQGDPNTKLDKRLAEIVKEYNPRIILCTCRSSGKTVHAVMAYEKDYDIIWTSTYQSARDEQHEELNRMKAKHILNLLQVLESL